jgi:spermidine/putrescine transport system permease protein
LFKRLRRVYAGLYLLLLYLPIAFVPLFSFNDSVYVAFPWHGFTLRWYAMLAGNAALLEALSNSLIVALSSALSATLVGLMAAKATTRYRFKGRALAIGALVAPLALPTVVIGVSLLSLFSMSGVQLSLATVTLGHFLICVPFAYGVLSSRLEGMNPDFELASGDLGEPPFATFWRVTLPLALPGIVSSLLLSFTISFDEFILAFFLSSNSPTLPVFMWSQMRFPDRLPMVLALASILIAFSAMLVLVAQRLSRTRLDRFGA